MYLTNSNKKGISGDIFREVVSAEKIYKLFEEEYSKKQEILASKFKTLTTFVQAKADHNKLIQQFILYRSANFISLIISTTLLWKFSLENTKSQFNCVVPFTSSDIPQQ